MGAERSRRARAVDTFSGFSPLLTVSTHMTQWHDLWQQQCKLWIDSINRNKQHGSCAYDFDSHRLTLVPRSCYNCTADTMDVPYQQLKPLLDTMDRQLMTYEVKMDASYTLAPTITIDRIHIYLDGAEAITELALVVDTGMLQLKGGLRTAR
mgnify:CR=1 FL=1